MAIGLSGSNGGIGKKIRSFREINTKKISKNDLTKLRKMKFWREK